MSALLGAFKAQKNLGIGAIGGKDSMSGSFEDMHVPPTLVSFAVTTEKVDNIISPEFKKSGNKAVMLSPEYDDNGLPVTSSLIEIFNTVTRLMRDGKVYACYTPTLGGIAEAIVKMCMGNGFGFEFDNSLTVDDLFRYNYGSFILEVDSDCRAGINIGRITDSAALTLRGEEIAFKEIENAYEDKLEGVYSCNIKQSGGNIETFSYNVKERVAPSIKVARPKVLIPAFPGTNCEYDSAKVMRDAGAEPEIIVINNLSASGIARSTEQFATALKQSQIVFIPGGFSGGDEPDGSGKFITAFFRNALIKEGVTDLLENRDGLMLGICNGFQALIKLGLLPYGKIIDTDESCPTLTFNTISRHQSKIVRTRIASNKSPWLAGTEVGEVYSVPISHGEGRFFADEKLILELAKNGQIATQYVDFENNATGEIQFNPNNSAYAIEGIMSLDGRVFGKMGHSERIGNGLYKNVPGNYDMKIFKSAVEYFK